MKIQEICTSITDGSHNPPQGINKSEYLMLSSKNIYDDNITFEDPRFLSKEAFDLENKRTRIQAGDVLLTIVGTVGRCAVVPEYAPKFTLQRSVAVLHPKEDVCSSRFLMYALQGKRSYIEMHAKGVAQKGIYLGEVANIDLLIPDKCSQLEVVTHLDRIAYIIRKRQQQIAALDDLIKARFVEMFGDHQENQGGIPLLDLSELVTVGIANAATQAYASSGVVMFRNLNIKENELDDSDLIYIKPEFAAKYASKILKKDDILVTRTGYPGVACLVPEKYSGAQTFTTLIVRLKEQAELLPTFVCHYINSPFGKRFVKKNQAGVAQQNFGATAMGKMPIVIPSIEAQREFIEFSEHIDKSKSAIQKSLIETQLLFDNLMQQYFG